MRAREFFHRTEVSGWTPERLIAAMGAADSGSLQLAADAVEQILTDDRVSGVLGTRTSGLLGLPLHFVGGHAEARHELEGSAEVPGEWDRQHDDAELVRLLEWGLVLGVGLAQRIPLPRARASDPHRFRIETWHPRWLRHDQELDRWHVQTKEGEKIVIPGDGQWILFTPYGARRPWAFSLWTKLAFPWILKRFSLEDRANHSQVSGSPLVVAKATKGSTERQRRQFKKELTKMTKDTRFVLPEGWDLGLVESRSTATHQIFSDQIAWADSAMTIIIAGQLVTTEGSPGFSSGNIHDHIKHDFIVFDEKRVSKCLHDQDLSPWANLNYGTPAAAPFPKWNTEKPTDLDALARMSETLGRGIIELNKSLKENNRKVDAIRMCEVFNIPVTVAEEEDRTTVQIPLAPTDVARTVTYNEVRRAFGLGDLPGIGEDLIQGRAMSEVAQMLGLPETAPQSEVVRVLRERLESATAE